MSYVALFLVFALLGVIVPMNPWRPSRQKSNSATITPPGSLIDTINGRPGFSIVVDRVNARASGGSNEQCRINGTDGISSSFDKWSETPGAAGKVVSAEFVGPHPFAENANMQLTIQGDATATSVGYTLDFHFEPCPLGWTGNQVS